MKKTTDEKLSLKGLCYFCNSEIEKSKMTQHLKFCKQRAASIAAEASVADAGTAEQTKFFHIVAEGRYNPQYWMHIELPATDILEDLDFFFRDTWVECCGHLSAFQIGDTSYSDEPEDFYFGDVIMEGQEADTEEEAGDEDEEVEEDEEEANELNLEDLPPELVEVMSPELLLKLKGFSSTEDIVAFLKEEQKTFPKDLSLRSFMGEEEARTLLLKQMLIAELIDMLEDRSLGVSLEKVLKVGQKFRYEYDFGSTTELSLRVAGEREGLLTDENDDVHVLARNVPPEYKCIRCGKPATQVAAGYDYWGVVEHTYCDACAKKDRTEDAWLPIVNSPRVGVCAYTGEDRAGGEGEWDEEDDWDEDEDEEE